MGLNKRTYVNGETVITAENLNEIQDSVIALEGEVPKKADASVIAAPFDENETYTFGDLVTHDGKLYKCNTTDFIFGDWDVVAEYFDEVTIFDEAYTKAQVDSALDLKADAEDVYTKTEIDTELEDYAKVDGSYEGMTVGNAEQLIATEYVEDSEPYLFRTTGGSADVGNREYVDEIVGGSLPWNQLSNPLTNPATQNGVQKTYDTTSHKITLAGTSTNNSWFQLTEPFALIKGHKYLLCGAKNYSAQAFMYIADGVNRTDRGNGVIWESPNGNPAIRVYYVIYNGVEINTSFYPMLFDLTQMFGSTIADYIYSLETATAGAGVAWFKKLFPNDYYEYNAGELISVSGLSSHDTVGFNQWDEEWEVGAINITNGANASLNTTIRSKNYIRILPNTTYYVESPVTILPCYYDADKNYIGYGGWVGSTTFTTRSDAYYMRFYCNAYGTTYNHDICINLSWSGYRNGEYEPYVKHSYPLDDSLTLRGIPKLDSSNNLYYDGDTYEHDGTVTRKYGIVDLGTLNWTYSSSDAMFYTQSITDVKNSSDNAVCEKYIESRTINNKSFLFVAKLLRVYDSAYTDAASFKTAMSGVYLVYELAEPTTENAEPYQQVQICDDFGTEEFVSTSIVPVGHNTRYPDNLRDKLQHLPSLAGSDGYYMISQQNNNMSLELFRIPKAPTTDGTYTLKATVSGGTPTYTWESEV